MTPKKTISVESAKSFIRTTTANALADALICGIDDLEQDWPLNQKQKIVMTKYSIMSYDNALESCELIEFESDMLKNA